MLFVMHNRDPSRLTVKHPCQSLVFAFLTATYISRSRHSLKVSNTHTAMVVGDLLLRARRPGICCQTDFVTQLLVSTFSGVTWKHFLRNIDNMYLVRLRLFLRMHYVNLHFNYYTNSLVHFLLWTPLTPSYVAFYLFYISILLAIIVCE